MRTLFQHAVTTSLALSVIACRSGTNVDDFDANSGEAVWPQVDAVRGPDGQYPACVGTQLPLEGETHVPETERVTYRASPPASGNHWACWAPWGTAMSELPPERYVHNLEHGGIVLLYRCAAADGCPDTRTSLTAFVADAPVDSTGFRRYLVSAASDLPSPFVALAWGWRLELDTIDNDALGCFARAHLGLGPEDVVSDPSPAACGQMTAAP